ncbi:hypothetical protein AAVH_08166 [Aphelenchoides avenae]|nr:hypothetical protein AAVH_08166 [Aphelenchus avenae]
MTVTEIATEERRDRLTWITLTVGFLLVFLAHALILVALFMKKPRLFNLYFFVQGFYVGVCIVRVVVLVYYLIVGSNKSGEPTSSPMPDDNNSVMRKAVDLVVVAGYLIFAVCCYIVVRRAKEAIEVEQSAIASIHQESSSMEAAAKGSNGDRYHLCGFHVKTIATLLAVNAVGYSVLATVFSLASEHHVDWSVICGYALVLGAHASVLAAIRTGKPDLLYIYFVTQGLYIISCAFRVILLARTVARSHRV